MKLDLITVTHAVWMLMRKAGIGTLVLSGAVLLQTDAFATDVYPHTDPGNLGNWQLQEAVSDEFDGTELDEDKWQVCGRDGFYWNGQFKGRTYNTDYTGGVPGGWQYSPDNIRVANGMLIITTEYDPDYPWHEPGTDVWTHTTGGMWSKALSGDTGYMEIRCKLADASVVGAFWTTAGSNHPPCEIDVFEAIGSPTLNTSRIGKMWSSLHDWSIPNPNYSWTSHTDLPFDFKDGFHTYAAEWGEDYLKIYADGVLIHETTRDWVENEALANGMKSDKWPLPGGQHIWADAEIFEWWGVPTEASLPADHEIEYIRVWEKGPPTLWLQYAADYGLSGVKTNHSDADGLNDWGEYVFDGNPTNPADMGSQPELDAATGEYTFELRNDTNIVAQVVTKTNLADADWNTNDTVNIAVHDGTMGAHARTLGTSETNLFIKLLVDEHSAPANPSAYQLIIGGSTGNGNFEAESAVSGETSFANTTGWHDLEGNDNSTNFGTDSGMASSPEPNSRGAYVFGHMAANDTGYPVVAAGETFDISLALHRYGGGYNGDEVLNATLFTTGSGVNAGTDTGDITVLGSTSFNVDASWASVSAPAFYTATASDVGKTVYLALDLDNPSGGNVYPRIDVVQLEVNK